jgi:hypothetical protein
MRKFITLSLLMATMMFTAVFANAAPKTNDDPQLWEGQPRQTRRIDQRSRYNRRGVVAESASLPEHASSASADNATAKRFKFAICRTAEQRREF